MSSVANMIIISKLHFLIIIAIFLLTASVDCTTTTDDDIKVIVYKGPTKCNNDEGEKPIRVEQDYIAAFHFTVTIDESTKGKHDVIGTKIESSHDVGFAPSFPVGQGKVIAGLDKGLIGLCKGAHAYIVVPPQFGYGNYGKKEQGVRGDTTLRYDVEIVDVQPPIPNDFIKIDSNKDWKISKSEAKKYFDGLGQQINLDALWEEEDKDKDGYIAWEEFTGPKGAEEPPKIREEKQKQQQQQQQQQQQEAQAERVYSELVKSIDTDQDGKISKSELADKFIKMGQPPMTDMFWKQSDPDGDGFVTYEEFIADMKEMQRQQQQQQQQGSQQQQTDMTAVVQSIDTDKDGRISKAELAETFIKLGQEMTEEFWLESDPDGDGYVTYQEFLGSDNKGRSGDEL